MSKRPKQQDPYFNESDPYIRRRWILGILFIFIFTASTWGYLDRFPEKKLALKDELETLWLQFSGFSLRTKNVGRNLAFEDIQKDIESGNCTQIINANAVMIPPQDQFKWATPIAECYLAKLFYFQAESHLSPLFLTSNRDKSISASRTQAGAAYLLYLLSRLQSSRVRDLADSISQKCPVWKSNVPCIAKFLFASHTQLVELAGQGYKALTPKQSSLPAELKIYFDLAQALMQISQKNFTGAQRTFRLLIQNIPPHRKALKEIIRDIELTRLFRFGQFDELKKRLSSPTPEVESFREKLLRELLNNHTKANDWRGLLTSKENLYPLKVESELLNAITRRSLSLNLGSDFIHNLDQAFLFAKENKMSSSLEPQLTLLRIRTYLSIEENEKALSLMNEFVLRFPTESPSEVAHLKGVCLLKLEGSRKNLELAKSEFFASIQSKLRWQSVYGLAEVYLRLGDISNAQKSYERMSTTKNSYEPLFKIHRELIRLRIELLKKGQTSKDVTNLSSQIEQLKAKTSSVKEDNTPFNPLVYLQ